MKPLSPPGEPFALDRREAVEFPLMPEVKAIAPLEFEKPLAEFEKRLEELRKLTGKQKIEAGHEISSLEKKLVEARRDIYGKLSPWQRVQIVRHPQRPYLLDYLRLGATEVVELGGDRAFGDDHALIGGFAMIGRQKVVFLGHQKGRDTKENLMRNFGCAHPEGYRKALRLMRLADRFGLPIVSFIDTPGAFPGVPSEERHIAEAIAVNIREMFNFRVPIVAVVIGEGGSGGALGIGVADRVLILENAYYSVISPEGCASILWKDRAFAPQAAEALRISAQDLLALKLVDEIVPEPEGGAHRNWEMTVQACLEKVSRHLAELTRLSPEKLLASRQDRYRAIGSVLEN
jgi:acetyl-CoA carboxylase carboxyl transferase subunit alpha